MTIRSIFTLESSILRQKSANVKDSEIGAKELNELIFDMQETMEKADGIGLAAPQVGVSKRVIIAELSGCIQAFINPRIISRSMRKIKVDEGCLSVPNVFGFVKRSKSIKLSALDQNWNKIKKTFSGLDAVIIQHEIDHLDGILFIDKVEKFTRHQRL
ncbi:MAG: hypothetical protein ACD_76C00106G0005 [uncultured bacterium]|nr:MAG: hypothetical protein ACD_76C00106G0005 [uncultured bacterium]